MSEKALKLFRLGLNPVLLGRWGDDLKRPLLKGWQTAVYTTEDVSRWPSGNNIGIRCGRQRNGSLDLLETGRALTVFDFDEEAARVFPAWRRAVEKLFPHPPVIVASARGYHVYIFTAEVHRGQTLAGRVIDEAAPAPNRRNGRKRLRKFIETLGRGRQVVTAGSRHPSGKRYRFINGAQYGNIPFLTGDQYQGLVAISKTFDERPPRPERCVVNPPAKSTGGASGLGDGLAGIQDCLEYARRFIGAEEQAERNGDIRFLGHGGLLVTADGRGWYAFSEDVGGGLAELIAWHQALVGER